MVSSMLRFVDHTRLTTVGRTPLSEWSARRRNLYMTTFNKHNNKKTNPMWDSNPQNSKLFGKRPTPSTARQPQALHDNTQQSQQQQKNPSQCGTRTYKIQNRLAEEQCLRPHGNHTGYQLTISLRPCTDIFKQPITIHITWCIFQNSTYCNQI